MPKPFLSLISLLFCLLTLCSSVDPPIYTSPYRISFDQSKTLNTTTYRINGQLFYDPQNSRQRMDRANGRYDDFCGSVMPGVTTPCQQMVVEKKRWLIYPGKSVCCFCCDQGHGCGIIRPDWLKNAQYQGQQKLIDTIFDKWHIQNGNQSTYFWATTDQNQIPRRYDVNEVHFIDYNPDSYHNQTIPFPDSIFTLPSYCNVEQPANCPLQSVCGQLRNNGGNRENVEKNVREE